MSRQTKAISEELIEKCKLELKRSGIRGEAGRRLQAIISAKDHGISKVAEIYNISRTTLMRWIERFEKENFKRVWVITTHDSQFCMFVLRPCQRKSVLDKPLR